MKTRKFVSGLAKSVLIAVCLLVLLSIAGLFHEEIGIATGKIPRGGIYQIDLVEENVITVRRLQPNSHLEDTDSWEFEDATNKFNLSDFYEGGRIDDNPFSARKGGFLFVWKHHLKDINLMALSNDSDRENAFKVWRSLHNW